MAIPRYKRRWLNKKGQLPRREGSLWTPGGIFKLCSDTNPGISLEELGFLQHLMRFKWDENKRICVYLHTLAEKTGTDKRTLQRISKNLEKKGILKRCNRCPKPTIYDLTPLIEKITCTNGQ